VRSLRLLERAVEAEPKVTAEFLAALPAGGSAYELGSRIKSPTSLARKFEDVAHKQEAHAEDVLRYTVLIESPDELVAAARHTVDRLCGSGWQVGYAMHS